MISEFVVRTLNFVERNKKTRWILDMMKGQASILGFGIKAHNSISLWIGDPYFFYTSTIPYSRRSLEINPQPNEFFEFIRCLMGQKMEIAKLFSWLCTVFWLSLHSKVNYFSVKTSQINAAAVDSSYCFQLTSIANNNHRSGLRLSVIPSVHLLRRHQGYRFLSGSCLSLIFMSKK